jgi:hypothetical protein
VGSLVDFLARAKGPRTFAHFLGDGLRGGYEAALRRHYGWDFDDLEQHWRGRAFAEPEGPAGPSAAGRCSAQPPPGSSLARRSTTTVRPSPRGEVKSAGRGLPGGATLYRSTSLSTE